MSADDLDIDLDAIQRRMDGAMETLKKEFAGLRTGRASVNLLDPVMATRLTQDRTKAVERSMAERSVKKEARPNKPHQG